MTNQDILEKVKRKLLYTVEDSLISDYIEQALSYACDITKFTVASFPENLKYYVIDAVVEALNKRGSEEKASENALGVSATFSFKDMEDSLKSKLRGKHNIQSLRGRI